MTGQGDAAGDILTIARLGHRGDGIAEDGAFVPFTLPGERVCVTGTGERRALSAVLVASPDRIAPICPHFGRCGGCALQHIDHEAYLAFKRDLVVDALAQQGLEASVEPVVAIEPHSRRRAVFKAIRQAGASQLGFHARLSHDLVVIGPCPILVPAIETRLAAIARTVAPLLGRREADVAVLATETGLDVAVSGVAPPAEIARFAEPAARAGIARLSVAGETVLQHAMPAIPIGRALVVPPPGGFVQAVAAAEAAMAAWVVEACAGAKTVADLFSGIGTFALRLAETARVTAVESDRAALAALDAAARRANGLKPVRTEARDLFRRPLLGPELRFDAIVFDPPRAGAQAQAHEIARSKVPVVVGVSCNPATFSRDARILVDGGYRLERVVPVDQFLFSPHIELVGLFRR